jgi:DNA-binding HxlR family transcriptional regulator
MRLLDLLGRRWTLRILWELREAPLTSRDLRAACDEVSPSVLQTRLGELRNAGLVAHRPGEGYHLTVLGAELMTAFAPLYAFADRWADRPTAPMALAHPNNGDQ